MADYRRPISWTVSLLVLSIVLTACGPNERETRQPAPTPVATAPSVNRDAVLNERLSRIQNQITELDHRISESAVASRQLNEEMTALRQEIATGLQAPAVVGPGATPGPVATAAPIVQPAPPAAAPAAEKGGANPLLWIIFLIILAFCAVFIVKHFMGMWADEEDEDWIDDESGSYEGEDEKIQLSPEMGESASEAEERNTEDEPKP